MSKRSRLRTRQKVRKSTARKSSRRKNCHHLAWPKHDYNGVRKQARDLPCCHVFLDIEVHRVLHDMYNFPRLMKLEDAILLVERHNAGACACYNRDGVLTNMLAINHTEGGEDDVGSTT